MGGFLAVVVGAGAALAVIAQHLQPYLRARLVSGLEQRFRTRVELDRFNVALGNGLEGEWGIWATGQGLRIWPPDPDRTRRDAGRIDRAGRIPVPRSASLSAGQEHHDLEGPPQRAQDRRASGIAEKEHEQYWIGTGHTEAVNGGRVSGVVRATAGR